MCGVTILRMSRTDSLHEFLWMVECILNGHRFIAKHLVYILGSLWFSKTFHHIEILHVMDDLLFNRTAVFLARAFQDSLDLLVTIKCFRLRLCCFQDIRIDIMEFSRFVVTAKHLMNSDCRKLCGSCFMRNLIDKVLNLGMCMLHRFLAQMLTLRQCF